MRLKRAKARIGAMNLRDQRGFPPNAHGRRIDDSYFAIWHCQNGHGRVGEPDSQPTRRCWLCQMDDGREPDPVVWTLCTPHEAHDFLFELESFRMYDGIGFVLSDEVRATVGTTE